MEFGITYSGEIKMARYYYVINEESVAPEKQKDVSTEKPHLQRVWPDRPTVYPDGTEIPDSLPNSYLPSQSCSNCAAYEVITSICTRYSAPVRASYWCGSWKEIK